MGLSLGSVRSTLTIPMKYLPAYLLLFVTLLPLSVLAQVEDLFAAYIGQTPGPEGFESRANFEAAQKVAELFSKRAEASDDREARGYTYADRDAGALYVLAEASDMRPGEPVEFFITTTNSGYNYESICIAYAPPSGIHQGLEFIGCKAGWPVDYSQLRFWPRGDEVRIEVMAAGRPGMRIETLATESSTTNALKHSDFVFVGSAMVPRPGGDGELVYAADVISPQSIAANFNLPQTVLDLPQQRSKSAVYGQHFYGREKPLSPRQPVVLVFKKAETQRGAAYALDVAGTGFSTLAFSLKDAAGGQVVDGGFADLLAGFDALTDAGVHPHVDISFGKELPLSTLRKLADILSKINVPSGIRIGPPPAGQLYFESYTPNQDFRDRMKRPTQPFELVLDEDGVELVDITEKWNKGKLDPELIVKNIPVPSPAELPAVIKASPNVRDTLFIYAAPDMEHGKILEHVDAVRGMFNVFFVYELE